MSSSKVLTDFFDYIIPAGETIKRRLKGDAIHIRRTPAPVTMRLDNRGQMVLRSKTGFRLPCGEEFEEIEFTNDNAHDIHVFGVACFGEYVEDGGETGAAQFRMSVVPTITAAAQKICDYNEGRRLLTLINAGAADLILGSTEADCNANLMPSVGSTTAGREFPGWTGELWARSTTAGGPFILGVEEISEA